MEQLTGIIEKATAEIEASYFLLPTAGDNFVYRERLYCYELYHQMRRLWSDGTYYLTGEISKKAHPLIKDSVPDLLVHEPGCMDNHAVIEVKTREAQAKGIEKDLENLSYFIGEAQYRRGIYLIFGEEAEAVAKKVICAADKNALLPQIELWIHSKAGESAKLHKTIGRSRVGSRE